MPAETTHCPLCGSKRGFKRLFDTINVSAQVHTKRLLTDSLVQPMYEQFQERKESAKRLEQQSSAIVNIDYRQMLTPDTRAASRSFGAGLIQKLSPPRPYIVKGA